MDLDGTSPDEKDLAEEWNQKGVKYAKMQMWHVAEEYFKNCIEAAPDNGEYWSNLGSVFGDQWRFAEAIPYYEKAVLCCPYEGRFWVKLGIAYRYAGDWEKELRTYREGLA